jgi:hypothetical protein
MMLYQEPADRRAMEARALIATLAVAAHAGWSFDQAGPVLDPAFARYLYVDTAGLLLVPTANRIAHTIQIANAAMREARSDALVVCAGHPRGGEIGFAFGEWRRAHNHWHVPMALFRPTADALWLVPEPYHAGVRGECFALAACPLRSKPAPWSSDDDHRAGRRGADAWLSRVFASG